MPFRVFGLLADAPARASAARIVSHNATYGCGRCTTTGKMVKMPGENRGRTTFPDLVAPLRTNESFRSRQQPAHHHIGRSFLEKLAGFDMVCGIAREPMHLLDIGAIKKMLLWMKAGKNSPARLKKSQVSTH